MAQIFGPRFDFRFRITALLIVLLVSALVVFLGHFQKSAFFTRVGVPIQQPVPFSHKTHAGVNKMDCRFCHTAVEDSPYAGIPSTQMCLKCHNQILKDDPRILPIVEHYKKGMPIPWIRIHDIPDFTYFDHSAHVTQGVACVTCHGRIDTMDVTRKEKAMFMSWCLDCHRNPEKFVRPKDRVFDMAWQPDEGQKASGARCVKEYEIKKMTDCSVCHR